MDGGLCEVLCSHQETEIFFFFKFIYLSERERERERERILSRLHISSAEPDVELELTNHEILTLPESEA